MQQRLDEVWTNRTCPVCSTNNNWAISEVAFSIKSPQGFAGPSQPVISAVCRNCGYTNFFNALVLGVLTVEDLTNPRAGQGGAGSAAGR
jgi:predicted nucleic-acid-binding Zn-ribbon protein